MFAATCASMVLMGIALRLAASSLSSSDKRRRPPRLHDGRWQAARLAAKIALIDPGLGKELRQVSRRIARLARMLEDELHRLRPLEARLEQVVRQVEDSSEDEQVDDELFERLAERFGVFRVRPALQRLETAHPDAPDDEH